MGLDGKVIVTATALAEFLGVSPAYVGKLARDGVLLKDERGRFDRDASITAYVGYMRGRAARRDADGRRQYLDARARQIAAQTRRAEADLIPVANLTELLGDLAAALIGGMRSMAASPDWPKAIRTRIVAEADDLEREVARRLAVLQQP